MMRAAIRRTFLLTYTFDADNGGWEGLDWAAPLDKSIWEWDSALGAWKVAWSFEYVDDNLVVENYYSKDVFPGGRDLTGISVIEYKVKTVTGAGYYDLFIQSVQERARKRRVDEAPGQFQRSGYQTHADTMPDEGLLL